MKTIKQYKKEIEKGCGKMKFDVIVNPENPQGLDYKKDIGKQISWKCGEFSERGTWYCPECWEELKQEIINSPKEQKNEASKVISPPAPADIQAYEFTTNHFKRELQRNYRQLKQQKQNFKNKLDELCKENSFEVFENDKDFFLKGSFKFKIKKIFTGELK